MWVAAAAAPSVFERGELAKSRLTSWPRKRAPCPHCETEMTLHGFDMSRFLGCESHGFWVDDDAIKQTGLGRVAVAPRLKAAYAPVEAMKAAAARAVQEAREREEQARREIAEQRAWREREVAERRREEQRARKEREAKERAVIEQRAAACRPYLELVADAVTRNQLLPLAEKLQEMDRAIAALTAKLEGA